MFSLMGNCAACLKRKPDSGKKVTLAIVGLDNAGKTVTTKGLQGEPLDTVAPTIGFSSADFKFDKYNVTLFDLGGGKRIRNIWQQYLFEIYGLIYVVDSSETERMDECREVLQELLEQPKVTGKPILLLANKQDKAGALDEIDICENLNLEELVNMNKCPCRVEMCAAIMSQGKKKKLDKSINDGMKWLLDTIYANFEKLNERVQCDVRENQEREAEEKRKRTERVKKQREEREREREAAKARGEIPESDDEDMSDFKGGDPFKKLSYEEMAKKEAMLKDKKRKKKEAEQRLDADSDDSLHRMRRHGSDEELHRHRNGRARTPRETRTRSRSPSPNHRTRARSLSPPVRNKSSFDNFYTNSKERLVSRKDSADDSDDPLGRGRLPWLKQKGTGSPPEEDFLSQPRGRGLEPLAPLDQGKKKKKKKSKRNQVGPDEDEADDTPRNLDGGYALAAPRGWNTPPMQRSTQKASKSPRLAPLQEPEHELDSFSSKWGLVDDLPDMPEPTTPRRTRPNSEYDDDFVT